jgi:hypothetical protein
MPFYACGLVPTPPGLSLLTLNFGPPALLPPAGTSLPPTRRARGPRKNEQRFPPRRFNGGRGAQGPPLAYQCTNVPVLFLLGKLQHPVGPSLPPSWRLARRAGGLQRHKDGGPSSPLLARAGALGELASPLTQSARTMLMPHWCSSLRRVQKPSTPPPWRTGGQSGPVGFGLGDPTRRF